MSSCTDKKFQARIHNYELGLLSDEERLEFEAHLLECDSCLEEVQELRQVTALIRGDKDVRATIGELSESGESEDVSTQAGGTRLWRRWLPTSAVAAVVLLFLLLSDWQLIFKPHDELQATENRLIVLLFGNVPDPTDGNRLGEIATNLLITDLSGSKYVDVVSSQRAADVARQVTSESGILDAASEFEMARITRSRWMLKGVLLQAEPRIVLSTQLVDVATGDVIASRRAEGTEQEDLFAVIDKLTPLVKLDLALPPGSADEPDPEVALVATNSTEAYRYYLDGVDKLEKFYTREAMASFEQAVRLDSTFAMAWYHLAAYEDTALISEALKWSEKVPRRERLYIEALAALINGDRARREQLLETIVKEHPEEKDALMKLGQAAYLSSDYAGSIVQLNEVLQLDPDYKSAYNLLAYAYSFAGNYDSSIWAINKYIELVPDEANPYDSRGDLYSFAGQLEKAKASFRQALEIIPTFETSLEKLGHMHTFSGEYRQADSCYNLLRNSPSPGMRSISRYYAAYIPMRRGRLNEAIEVIDAAIAGDRADSTKPTWLADKYIIKGMILAEQERWEEALAVLDSSIALDPSHDVFDDVPAECIYARTLAEIGRVEEARTFVETMRPVDGDSDKKETWYLLAGGMVDLADKKPREALEKFRKRFEMKQTERNFQLNYGLAQAYLESGLLAKAVEHLEWQIHFYECPRLFWGLENVKMHYLLGKAYEESHWFEKAREQYEIFLRIWKDADYNFPEIEDARLRLARLKE